MEENIIIKINKYRGELLGIATIMIIITHSISIINFSDIVKKIFAYGTQRVNVFLFLSGIGLYNSLKNKNDKILFYKKRIEKVFIPYFVIAGIWYSLKYLIFEKGEIIKFLYELSTLSFWMEHLGAWYVAFLIPLYFLYPFYFNYKKDKQYKYIYIFILFVISVLIEKINLKLYLHLSQMLVGLIVFFIGDYIAHYTCKNTFNDKKLLLFFILFFIIKTTTPLKNIFFISALAAGFLGIVIVILGAHFFAVWKNEKIYKVLIKIGNYSLESYLYNIFLIQAVKYFKIKEIIKIFNNIFLNEVIIYLGVIILGFIFSMCTRKLIDFFIKTIKKY